MVYEMTVANRGVVGRAVIEMRLDQAESYVGYLHLLMIRSSGRKLPQRQHIFPFIRLHVVGDRSPPVGE